jgi:hypothetical protein
MQYRSGTSQKAIAELYRSYSGLFASVIAPNGYPFAPLYNTTAWFFVGVGGGAGDKHGCMVE